MTDSTDTNRRCRRLAAAFAALAFAFGTAATAARADGDPASDVLATQAAYLPQDAGVPIAQQAQLAALLRSAGRAGYKIRVAVIASATDLGSVGELWRQPQNYARFLGQELSLVYSGPLLVVMPDGYGLYHGSAPQLPPAQPRQLGAAALTAVQRLAAADGHPVALPPLARATSAAGDGALPWVAFAIGAAMIALAWGASLRARPLHYARSSSSS